MLRINTITSLNIDGIPLLSNNLQERVQQYRKFIKENIKNNSNNEEELEIFCVHGLYGYRVGLLGWLSTFLSYKISQFSKPKFLQRLFNYKILGNDYEIISGFISLISRMIPFLNIKNWDTKTRLFPRKSIVKNRTKNLSMPSIYNLKSIYLLSPIFDCGSAIYANKKPLFNGYERWKIWKNLSYQERMFNKGMLWTYFESSNQKNGISVITVNLEQNVPTWIIDYQIDQIVSLKNSLENRFNKNTLESYETYIVGDFKLELNLTHLEENEFRYNILKNSNLKIISKSNSVSTTHFILYSNSNMFNYPNLDSINTSNFQLEQDDILSVKLDNNIDKTVVIVENPMYDKEEIVEIELNEKVPNENIQVCVINDNEIDVKNDTNLEYNIRDNIQITFNDEYFNKEQDIEIHKDVETHKDKEWIEI
jgi:hypothetical protein